MLHRLSREYYTVISVNLTTSFPQKTRGLPEVCETPTGHRNSRSETRFRKPVTLGGQRESDDRARGMVGDGMQGSSRHVNRGDLSGPRWVFIALVLGTKSPRAGVRASIVAKKRGNSRGAKGGVWFSLIDKIQRPKTLNAAWAAVKRKGGGAGSDHQGIEDFEKDLGGEIERFCEALRTADGGYRRLYSRWTCAGADLNILSTATNRPFQSSING